MMNKIVEIYVANLEAYSRGDLVGEWISLPMEEELLVKELKEIGGEEQAIHDVCDTIGLDITEYTDIKDLNNFLKELSESNYIEEIKALLEGNYITLVELLKMDKYDIQNFVENFTILYIDDDIKHLKECSKIAYTYIDMLGGIEHVDERTLENHFNYASYGRDLQLQGVFVSDNDLIIL